MNIVLSRNMSLGVAFFLSAAILTTSPATAYAADWRFFSRTENELTFFDRGSERRDGGNSEVWFDTEIVQIGKDGISGRKNLYRINCANQTLTLLMSVTYGRSGTVLKSRTVPSYLQQEDRAVPESIGAGMVERVCQAEPENLAIPVRSPRGAADLYLRIRHHFRDKTQAFVVAVFVNDDEVDRQPFGGLTAAQAAAVKAIVKGY